MNMCRGEEHLTINYIDWKEAVGVYNVEWDFAANLKYACAIG